MELFGNDSDPLAKTLQQLQENSQDSKLGNAGDFFTPVHPRDTHVKAKNQQESPLEFNSAILKIDDSSVMQQFIFLKNKIVMGECLAVGESINVDKEDASISIFIQWLQPNGMFEIGTANATLKGAEVKKKENSTDGESDVVNDTQSSGFTKRTKGKGSRKKNQKVKL